jgi:hypothetical protein
MRLSVEADWQAERGRLEQKYRDALRRIERDARREVELVYGHHRVEREERAVDLVDSDLFSTDHWYFWGLDRRQLVATGAAGGAVLGGALDASVGGASLLLGSAIGATVGGAAAWLSRGRLERTKVMSLPLGGRLLRCGPSRDANLPWVVLGRALHHHARIAGRSHADRGALDLADRDDRPSWSERLAASQRKAIERAFGRLRRGGADDETSETLTELLVPLLDATDLAPGT